MPAKTKLSSNSSSTFPLSPPLGTNQGSTPIHSNSSPTNHSTTHRYLSTLHSKRNCINDFTPSIATTLSILWRERLAVGLGGAWNLIQIIKEEIFSMRFLLISSITRCISGQTPTLRHISNGFASKSKITASNMPPLLSKICSKRTCSTEMD